MSADGKVADRMGRTPASGERSNAGTETAVDPSETVIPGTADLGPDTAGGVAPTTTAAGYPLGPLDPLGRARRLVQRVRVPRTGAWAYLAALGPGLIAANAGNDAGGIATYA